MKTIKSLFLIIAFSFICSYKTTAQVYLGAKTGGRFSWLNYEDFASEDYSRKPFFGYSAGLTAAIKVQKRFLLQLDILYVQNGKKVESTDGPLLQNDAKYHFLNTPLVYKLDFKRALGDRTFKWYVGAGPNVNFWLAGTGQLNAVELREENIEQLNYNIIFEEIPANPEFGSLYYSNANRLQVGLIASLGLVLEPAAGQTLMIDFRYEWGHSYMARSEGTFADVLSYDDDLIARNQAIQISVAYLFDIINKGKKEKKLYYQN